MTKFDLSNVENIIDTDEFGNTFLECDDTKIIFHDTKKPINLNYLAGWDMSKCLTINDNKFYEGVHIVFNPRMSIANRTLYMDSIECDSLTTENVGKIVVVDSCDVDLTETISKKIDMSLENSSISIYSEKNDLLVNNIAICDDCSSFTIGADVKVNNMYIDEDEICDWEQIIDIIMCEYPNINKVFGFNKDKIKFQNLCNALSEYLDYFDEDYSHIITDKDYVRYTNDMLDMLYHIYKNKNYILTQFTKYTLLHPEYADFFVNMSNDLRKNIKDFHLELQKKPKGRRTK